MTRLWGVKCFTQTSFAKQSSCSWSWQHFSKKPEKSAVTASCCSSVMSGFCFTRLMRSLGFKTKGNTGASTVQWHFPKMLLVEHFQSPGRLHPQPSLLLLIARLSLHMACHCPALVQVTDEILCQDLPRFYGMTCSLCLACLHYPFLFPLLQCGLSMHTGPDV